MLDPDLNNSEEEKLEDNGENDSSPDEVEYTTSEPVQPEQSISAADSNLDPVSVGDDDLSEEDQQDEVSNDQESKLIADPTPQSLSQSKNKEMGDEQEQDSLEESINSSEFYSTYTARGWYKRDERTPTGPDSEQAITGLDEDQLTEDTQPIIVSPNISPIATNQISSDLTASSEKKLETPSQDDDLDKIRVSAAAYGVSNINTSVPRTSSPPHMRERIQHKINGAAQSQGRGINFDCRR